LEKFSTRNGEVPSSDWAINYFEAANLRDGLQYEAPCITMNQLKQGLSAGSRAATFAWRS
jgi:hypothetical protein